MVRKADMITKGRPTPKTVNSNGQELYWGRGNRSFCPCALKKSHSLKETHIFKKGDIRTLPSGGRAMGKLSWSEAMENKMVYIPTPP